MNTLRLIILPTATPSPYRQVRGIPTAHDRIEEVQVAVP